MNLVRCEKGHFYDEERFASCPHCANMNEPQSGIEITEPFDDENLTMKLDEELNKSSAASTSNKSQSSLSQAIAEAKSKEPGDEQKTVGYFNKAIGSEPVVGWLVCVEGNHFGEDFKLKSGRNFVGRAKNMDVILDGDPSISREKHAIILYEPKNNIFIAQPGDSKELFYLNDKVVLSSVEMNANDVISLGETKLLFIPCCTDKFNWDDVKENKDKE